MQLRISTKQMSLTQLRILNLQKSLLQQIIHLSKQRIKRKLKIKTTLQMMRIRLKKITQMLLRLRQLRTQIQPQQLNFQKIYQMIKILSQKRIMLQSATQKISLIILALRTFMKKLLFIKNHAIIFQQNKRMKKKTLIMQILIVAQIIFFKIKKNAQPQQKKIHRVRIKMSQKT